MSSCDESREARRRGFEIDGRLKILGAGGGCGLWEEEREEGKATEKVCAGSCPL